jgi:hypothetical protein
MDRRLLFYLVALLQLSMLTRQFVLGFWPLRHDPQRVSFSWDMFATTVVRCDLRWDSPVVLGGRHLSALSDLNAPIEWNVIFDTLESYRLFAATSCSLSPAPQSVDLHCFLPNGTVRRERHVCRH